VATNWWEQDYEEFYGAQGTDKQIKKMNALDTLQSKEFVDTLKDYYTYKTGENFFDKEDADVIEEFYDDRTWANYNTIGITGDLSRVMGENDPRRLRQFSEINNLYMDLPNFWNDPNRNFGQWLMDMGGAMITDPLNIIGFGVGGKVAKQEYKRQLRNALRGKVAKEIDRQAIEAIAKSANRKALGSAIKRGAIYEGAYSGLVSGVQDALLQNTSISSGATDEFSFKRLGINTAFGTAMGTVFGGAFSAGGFKLALAGQKKTTIRQLKDIHEYGFDELTGKRLFADLSEPKSGKQLYKNKDAEEIARIKKYNEIDAKNMDDYITKMRETARQPFGKPPKDPFNYQRWAEGDEDHTVVELIRQTATDIKEQLDADVASNKFQQIREEAALLGADPEDVVRQIKETGDTNLAAYMLAMRTRIKHNADLMIKSARQIDDVTLSSADRNKLKKTFEQHMNLTRELLVLQKRAQERIATALASQRQKVDDATPLEAESAIDLLVNPEKAEMQLKIEGNIEDYMRAVSKIYDDNHMILSLQNVQKVNKWDLAAEYVNNNLLSSPDTHLLNIASGLMQTQWKPLTMLFRAMYLSPTDSKRAAEVANEALETYVYQYVYTIEAVRSAFRSFKAGRPLLDSRALKYDSNIRQGQLANYLNEMVASYTNVLPTTLARTIQGAAKIPITVATVPLRVLSAGDEFLKTLAFKARAAAQINSRIARDNPEVFTRTRRFKDRQAYKQKVNEMMKEYIDESGKARSTVGGSDISMNSAGLSSADRLEVNDPLHYAREASYTQPATSQAQKADGTFVGDTEGRVTGAVLDFTARHRWTRAMGLHFINTPSNLIRWNFQHLPILGRYQFQMKQMLKKDASGAYINPEAAAEANARITMGYMIWIGAFYAAISGKVTGGGERDYRKNLQKEVNTGWQPYSYKTQDGRYISMNRLDPFFTPFGIAADMVYALDKFYAHNESLTQYQESRMTELAMGAITSLTRNFTSKFYTKGMLETVDLFLGDGLMHTKDPERKSALFLGRFGFKFAPLSGMFRYINRVNDDYSRELWGLSDQLNSYKITDDPDAVMPRRNMFGEKIDRQNGWLFGIGGKEGIWSSPFSMTTFANTETAKFFSEAGRTVDYLPPSKIAKHTNINLKDLKNAQGQTAYDRWMEIKSEITIPYKGFNASLKEIVEFLITNPKSPIKRLPTGKVEGEDMMQQEILKVVRQFERAAYEKMLQEFPQINEERRRRETNIQREVRNALDAFVNQ